MHDVVRLPGAAKSPWITSLLVKGQRTVINEHLAIPSDRRSLPSQLSSFCCCERGTHRLIIPLNFQHFLDVVKGLTSNFTWNVRFILHYTFLLTLWFPSFQWKSRVQFLSAGIKLNKHTFTYFKLYFTSWILFFTIMFQEGDRHPASPSSVPSLQNTLFLHNLGTLNVTVK